MSDIYLQITETPTVVTLSAPVISGALSSTVTVANTVTVALDSNSLSALENVTVTVGAAVTISNFPATQAVSLASVPTHGVTLASTTVTVSSLPAISGTVTASIFGKNANSTAILQIPLIAYDEGIESATDSFVIPVQVTNGGGQISGANPLPISGTVTANINGFDLGESNLPVIQFVADAELNTIRSSLWIADSSGNNGSASEGQILSQNYPMPISGTVTISNIQGTAVTTSNFTSTTPSTVLAGFNATRKVLTIFNEGAGNLHICAGATCTTIAYQVRLSTGDYYEAPLNQTSVTHSAVFASAGTARVTQVS
jgi:hypothetical protein